MHKGLTFEVHSVITNGDSVGHYTVIKRHNEKCATRNKMYNKLQPRGGSYQRHEQVIHVM
jgi:hypothetical protein